MKCFIRLPRNTTFSLRYLLFFTIYVVNIITACGLQTLLDFESRTVSPGIHHGFQGSLGSAPPAARVCRKHLLPLQGKKLSLISQININTTSPSHLSFYFSSTCKCNCFQAKLQSLFPGTNNINVMLIKGQNDIKLLWID